MQLHTPYSRGFNLEHKKITLYLQKQFVEHICLLWPFHLYLHINTHWLMWNCGASVRMETHLHKNPQTEHSKHIYIYFHKYTYDDNIQLIVHRVCMSECALSRSECAMCARLLSIFRNQVYHRHAGSSSPRGQTRQLHSRVSFDKSSCGGNNNNNNKTWALWWLLRKGTKCNEQRRYLPDIFS